MSAFIVKVGASRFKLADMESGRVAHGLTQAAAVALEERFGPIVAMGDGDWALIAAALDTAAEVDDVGVPNVAEPEPTPDPPA